MLDGIDLRVSARGSEYAWSVRAALARSSLLRVVAGLVPSASGAAGCDLAAGPLPALGWVPQHPTVVPATVLDNVALGRPGVDERIARQVLEVVGLGSWLRSLPQGLRTPLSGLDAPLSLGERRRLAVARSLAGPRPRLWLLDEPTAGLDRAGVRRLVAELGRIIDGDDRDHRHARPVGLPLGQRAVELSRGQTP